MYWRLFKFNKLSLEYPYLTNTRLNNSNLDKYCSAPLYRQVFNWFRKKHNLLINITGYSKERICELYNMGLDYFK